MPELAEVETVKETLKKKILQKRIKNVKILYSKIIENDLDEFKKIIINNEIMDIKRRGKYLIFELKNHYLISHLRMEGKFFIKDLDEEIQKHEHIIFEFDTFSLRYHDTRKFGRMIIIPKEGLESYFKNLGPDANKCDDSSYLYNLIHHKKLPIKTLLLDQSIIAGLGNIYVDEVLFACGINPLRSGEDITLKECTLILNSSKKILNKAIKYKGTTIRSYTSSLGVYGEYQKFLCVHTKDGEKCPKCGETILKTRVGGRGTYYCPKCQV